jgi:superoxide dismutase, Fe-Mn family
MSDLKKDIKNVINNSLKGVLKESYVTQPKKFDLKTEALSEKVKLARQADFEVYVKTLNEVSAQLDTVDRDSANDKKSMFRGLKLDEVHNMNAAFLRALHFENISDLSSSLTMDMISYLRLDRDFGGFDAWQKDFIACAMSSRDGYAITGYSVFLKRYLNVVIDTESLNVPVGFIPVISLDVAEGAYFRDYLSDRKKYVSRMMKEFNWDVIEKRFDRVEKSKKNLTV